MSSRIAALLVALALVAGWGIVQADTPAWSGPPHPTRADSLIDGDGDDAVLIPTLGYEEIESRLDAAHARGLKGIPSSELFREISPDDLEPRALGLCAFLTDGDDPHRTGNDASAHGFWRNINCPRGTKAAVTIYLHEKIQGAWYTVGSGRATVYAGGGAGKRATARSGCFSRAETPYKSSIDVNLIGRPDSPGYAWVGPKSVPCY